MLESLLRHVRRLQILSFTIWLVAQLGEPGRAIILTLLLQDLCVGHERVVFDARNSLLQLITGSCCQWQLLLAVDEGAALVGSAGLPG